MVFINRKPEMPWNLLDPPTESPQDARCRYCNMPLLYIEKPVGACSNCLKAKLQMSSADIFPSVL